MTHRKVCITTDCACDLPEEVLRQYDVDLMYFYIETETGRFKDVDEISARNIFEYMESCSGKCVSKAPPTEDFLEFFNQKLRFCDEIIHIAISSKISNGVRNATNAANRLGAAAKRIHIFDSEHLSTGIGLLVLRAAEMAERGMGCEAILAELEKLRARVSTTFIAPNADYLYLNGQVSNRTRVLCNVFQIHPVLEMREGHIRLKSLQLGNFEKSAIRYIQKQLKNPKNIESDRLFITHAGCTVSDLRLVRREVDKLVSIDQVMVTQASATISGNSGPRTFGVLFIKKA